MATIMTQNNFPSGSSTKKLETAIDRVDNFLRGSTSTTLDLETFYATDSSNKLNSNTYSMMSRLYMLASSSQDKYAAFFPMTADGTSASTAGAFVDSSNKYTEPKSYTVSLKGLNGITDPYNQNMIIMIGNSQGGCGMYFYNANTHQITEEIQYCIDVPLFTEDGNQYTTNSDTVHMYDQHVAGTNFGNTPSSSYDGSTYIGLMYDSAIFKSLAYCPRGTDIEDMTNDHILLPMASSHACIDRYQNGTYSKQLRMDIDLQRTVQIPIQNPINSSGELLVNDFFVGLVSATYSTGSKINGASSLFTMFYGDEIRDHLESPSMQIRVLPMDPKIIAGVSLSRARSRSVPTCEIKIVDSVANISKMSLAEQNESILKYLDNLEITDLMRIQDSIFGKDTITFDDVTESMNKFYTEGMSQPCFPIFIQDKVTGDNYVIIANPNATLFRYVKYNNTPYGGRIFIPKFINVKGNK